MVGQLAASASAGTGPGRPWRCLIVLLLGLATAFCDGGGRDGESGRSAPDRASDPFSGSAPSALTSEPVVVVDDAGRPVRLAAPARRIVSLVPAITETIAALGGADRVVGRTDYDVDPRFADVPSVGGGLTPSLEAIAALEPDLVVAWEEAGTARIRGRLEDLGIQVFSARTQDTTAIYSTIERFGRILDRDRSADSLAAALREEFELVRRSVDGVDRPTVLYAIGLDPPIIAGPRVFIGQMLEIAGGRNVFADVDAASPQVSVEEIVQRAPDIVVVPTNSDPRLVTERMAGLAGWRELLAGGKARVVTIPADLLHRPGPGIGAAVTALRDAIHGGDPR